MGHYIEESMKGPAISKTLAMELEQYKGRWVAVDKEHVVGSGTSAKEAKDAAKAKNVTDPLIFRVSTGMRRLRMR